MSPDDVRRSDHGWSHIDTVLEVLGHISGDGVRRLSGKQRHKRKCCSSAQGRATIDRRWLPSRRAVEAGEDEAELHSRRRERREADDPIDAPATSSRPSPRCRLPQVSCYAAKLFLVWPSVQMDGRNSRHNHLITMTLNATELLPAVSAGSYDLFIALLLPLLPIAAFGALADPYINPWCIAELVNNKWCASRRSP